MLIKLFKYILLADDTNLLCSGKILLQLGLNISTELEKLKIWFEANKLSLNLTKTNHMVFSNYKFTPNLCIKICIYYIDKVKSTKFLGVLLDEKLTWKEHIVDVNKKYKKLLVYSVK